MKEWLQKSLLYPLLLSLLLILLVFYAVQYSHDQLFSNVEARGLAINQTSTINDSKLTKVKQNGFITSPRSPPRYLSYQPPGNGWNNQRIALEGALLMAKLLNRTLIVHPLASHRSGEKMKKYFASNKKFGHITYNRMPQSNLLPLSLFLDLELMSQLVPVVEFNSTHKKFLKTYSNLRWHRICHSMGFGYWANRHPKNEEENLCWNRQTFYPVSYWRGKCPIEIEESMFDKAPVVKYVSDFEDDDSEMLYVEEGTLFGIQFRFMSMKEALQAQQWIVKHVKYRESVYEKAGKVKERLGKYNAVHVRRLEHIGSEITKNDWLVKIMDEDYTTDIPIYIATDESNMKWFDPIVEAGFKLFFAKDFEEILNFSYVHHSVRTDLLGIHEQIICELADKFIPTEHSTFSMFIKRLRGEVDSKNGLYQEAIHTFWIKHTYG